jgi:hypothetical protein
MIATERGGGPSGSKAQRSVFVRLSSFFVLSTILPPVGPDAFESRSNSSAVSTLGCCA